MASLTHVCMWSDNGWKRVTAEEADLLHPGGTVSAHSGLFMCELCGQYVAFTKKSSKCVRHFMHSKKEESKNCPERIFGPGYYKSYEPQEHGLPIRITSISSTSFCFEIGLIKAPVYSLSSDFRLEIKPCGSDEPFIYTKERLNNDGITYLPIGERPSEKYTLTFQNGNDKLHEFWPTEIKGINPEGTLFDKASGKKLSYDADVEIDKEYYLLKCGSIYNNSNNGVKINEIMRKNIGWATWTLYVVSASVFNKETAGFFLGFHCRLTNQPISLQPVWPLFVEGEYVIKHGQRNMYMLVKCNETEIEFKTFPSATFRRLSDKSSRPEIYEVICSDRQQLISVGRSSPLQYTYLWKESLDGVSPPPNVLINNLEGKEVKAGETNTLPFKKTLCFKSSLDGEVIVINNNRVVDKRKLAADKCLELDGLCYGFSVQVVIGLDVIWQIDFNKPKTIVSKDEIEILKQITKISGATIIPAPHSLRNIMVGMNRYPKICQWIRKCIKNGTINEQSYRRLQAVYLNMNGNR